MNRHLSSVLCLLVALTMFSFMPRVNHPVAALVESNQRPLASESIEPTLEPFPSIGKTDAEMVSPALVPQYDGMVKPLNIRDYNGACGDGYTGLYPDYGGCATFQGVLIFGPHPGVDMAGGLYAIGCRTPVVAVCNGPIIRVETYSLPAGVDPCGNNTNTPYKGAKHLGWQIVLRCDNVPDATWGGAVYGGTVYAVYGHLSRVEPGLDWGVWVAKGQKLGEVGSTGQSEAPHLHFQLEKENGGDANHPGYWHTTAEILAYTWNHMYFIQAHEQTIIPPEPPPSNDCLKPLLRYWNNTTRRHFYTSLWDEMGGGSGEWIYEQYEGYVAVDSNCYAAGAVPFYRLWHWDRRKHFYTASESERDYAIQQYGFVLEGVSGYLLPQPNDALHTIPLYRCYSASQDDHFYTTDWSAVEAAQGYGYLYESIAGYIFSPEALVPHVPVDAGFDGSPVKGPTPLLVAFTNQSTGEYTTCTWTFGDGKASSSCGNPTHTYMADGLYTVSLTVSGPGGTDTVTKTAYIEVWEKHRVYLPLCLRGH